MLAMLPVKQLKEYLNKMLSAYHVPCFFQLSWKKSCFVYLLVGNGFMEF